MNIRLELLKACIAETVAENFNRLNIDVNEIVDTKATQMLSEVLIAVRDSSLSDFDVVEKIVVMFEENNITCLGRHDF